MKLHNLPVANWRKSSYSGDTGGQCIEVQPVSGELVAVGDSKDRAQGAFGASAGAWSSFVASVAAGQLGA